MARLEKAGTGKQRGTGSALIVAAAGLALLGGVVASTAVAQVASDGETELVLTEAQQQALAEAVAAAEALQGDARALTELVYQLVMQFPDIGPTLVNRIVQSSDSFRGDTASISAVVRGAVLANPASASAVASSVQGIVTADVQNVVNTVAAAAQQEASSEGATAAVGPVEDDEATDGGTGTAPTATTPTPTPAATTPPPASEPVPSPS